MVVKEFSVSAKALKPKLFKLLWQRAKTKAEQLDPQLQEQTAFSLKLYDRSNIGDFRCPDNSCAAFAERYLLPFIANGLDHYIDNMQGEMRILQVGEHVLPLLVINNSYDNSYVCSPYGHYISLALENLDSCMQPRRRLPWQPIAKSALSTFGNWLKKRKINQIVYVNHWLLSTDLYPANFSAPQLAALLEFLTRQFPQHAIAFRSLNATTTQALQCILKNQGFELIASRQIYLTDTKENALFNTRIVKSDLKLWNEKEYSVVMPQDLTSEDKARILHLYSNLAISAHSELNPKLNSRFIELAIEEQLLKIKALKKGGTIDGVVGYFERDGVLMCPLFGYDKSHPDKTRLYRLLSTLLLLDAHEKKLTFHQGAGASFFKTVRRAMSQIEFMGIYHAHLPYQQRLSWKLLQMLINGPGLMMMKKY